MKTLIVIGYIVAFFFFLAILKNLYMIHLDLSLFYEVYNTINQHYQK